MKRRDFLALPAAAATALALPAWALDAPVAAPQAAAPPADAPLVDHHQHLFSPAMARLLDTGAGGPSVIAAKDLVGLLDTAGIRRAVLLSVAYVWGSPARKIEDELAKVRAENDFNGAQAALYPDRLLAFCSINPLKEYALDELERCAALPDLKHGLKLHFGNSDVQLELPEHVARLRQVFAAANAKKMAIAVHMRASISKRRSYGAAQARIFLEQLLPAAPDVTVQVAHLAGTGPGYGDPPSDEALGVLADAVAARDPHTKRLWFDAATMANPEITPQQREKLAQRIRQIGAGRVLFGSDAAAGKNLRPRESWAAFRQLPLSEAEFKRIAENVAPYMR